MSKEDKMQKDITAASETVPSGKAKVPGRKRSAFSFLGNLFRAIAKLLRDQTPPPAEQNPAGGTAEAGTEKRDEPETPVWSNGLRYIALVGVVIVIVFLAYFMRGSITLLVISALVAYLLNPIARFFNKKLHLNRNLSVVLVYILLIIVIIVAVSNIIPGITQSIQTFFTRDLPIVVDTFEEYLENFEQQINDLAERTGTNIDVSQPFESVKKWLNSIRPETLDIGYIIPDLSSTLKTVLSFSTNIVSQILAWLILAVTAIMSSIHMCRDGHKLPGFVVGLFEEKYQPEVRELINRITKVWSRYFAGELKLMLWIGLITFVVYMVLGIRWALLLSVIAGFCEVIPTIGPILATVPAVISALIFGSSYIPLSNIVIAVLVVIASILIQQTENVFLVPHIMGSALELHPVVLLIGILALSSRLGVIGALFAAPLIALSKELLSFVIHKIKLEDPYPEIYEKKRIP